MKISIVIPTKNSEKYIQKCLKSILEQTYSNIEILICDSSSKDKTIEVIKKNIHFNNKIKIVSYEDLNVADALNIGFKNSNGEILTWLNSDDYYYDKNSLNLIVDEFVSKKKEIDYVVGDFVNVDESGKIIDYFISYIPIKKKIRKFYFFNQIFTGSLFFKKKIFNNNFKFNDRYNYAFEYELLVFLLKNFNGNHINNFISCFTIRDNQLSSNKKSLNLEFNNIMKENNLMYSNNILLRIYSYLSQGSLIRFLKYKIFK